MKLASIIVLLCCSSVVYSQISRGIQSKTSTKSYGSNGIYENSNLHQYKIETFGTAVDTLYLENIVYDKQGDVLELNNLVVLSPNSSEFKIIGVHQKSPNVHLLHLFNGNPQVPSEGKHRILEFNTNTNSVVQNVVLNIDSVARVFSESISVGGQIVTYMIKTSGGLYRIAFSPNDLNTISEELVDISVPSTFSVNGKLLGFSTNGVNEFISCSPSQKLYKRLSTNNFSSSVVVLPVWAANSNTSSASSSSEILVSFGSRYCLFASNLDSLQTGVFSFQFSGGPANATLAAQNNSFYAFFSNSNSKIHEYNNTMQLMDSLDFNLALKESFFVKMDDFISIFSGTTGTYFGTLNESGIGGAFGTPDVQKSTIAFTTKNLSNAAVLSDYGHLTSSKGLEIYSSNVFHVANTGTNFGAFHVENERKSPLAFSISNNFIGTSSGNIHGDYGLFSNAHYQYGPFTNVSNYNWFLQSKYTRGFFVTKQMIIDHIDSLNFGSSTYVPTHGIRNWPAHGDLSIGQAAKIAPFIDADGDGQYNAMEGDYPKIYGDECLLTIGHMPASTSTSSEMEIHSYRFTYLCDTSELMQKTIFQKNFYIPRTFGLDTVYAGVYADFDIGYSNDDFCGTNVELGLIYGYNGDNFDEPQSSFQNFGDTIPAFGILNLQGVKQFTDGQDNTIGVGGNRSVNGKGFEDGIVDNEYWGITSSNYFSNGMSFPYSDPSNLAQGFYLAQGLYSNGTSQGMEGFPYSLGIPFNHAFFGNSDPLFYSSNGVNHGNNFSETSIASAPSDRRILCSSGPGTLALGDTLSTVYAFLFSTDKVNVSPANSVNKLFEEASQLRSYFTSNNAGCGATFGTIQEDLLIEEKQFTHVKIYPNPTKEKFYITGLEGKTDILLFDLNGSVLINTTTADTTLEMDLSNLAEGMYFVQLHNSKGSVLKKVVRN